MKKRVLLGRSPFRRIMCFGGDRLFRQENEYKFHRDRDQGSSKKRR